MSQRSTRVVKALLSTLHYTGVGALVAPWTRGQGVIFTLHHVLPASHEPFDPNRLLKITPEFLDTVIGQVRDAGFELISLDDAAARMKGDDQVDKPFACITFDDGYKDNARYALPVLERHRAPFTIYVPTDYADGNGELWWLALERVIRLSSSVAPCLNGQLVPLSCRTVAEKYAAYERIYWWLRAACEYDARHVVRDLCKAAGVDQAALCRELVMDWVELRALSKNPLVTIGAHTRRHFAISKLPLSLARQEIAESVSRIEHELERPCRHFSFPYGDKTSADQRDFDLAADVGLSTAVTTRKGLINKIKSTDMTGLPRVSLNGNYQESHYVKVLLTGAPFAFLNMLRRPAQSAM